MELYGTKYQTPMALVIGKANEFLRFGEVNNIYVHGDQSILFEISPMTTNCFYGHFHAYVLSPGDSTKYFIKHSELLDYHPYGLYTSLSILPDASLLYVIPRTNIS